MCGGTTGVTPDFYRSAGLSPRVRGNRRHRERHRHGRGSIPACAGEPIAAAQEAGVPEVYPRVCGGTHRQRHFHRRPTGLSPRVRGNHRGAAGTIRGARSIPACAGEPPGDQHGVCRNAVYPRVCGGTAFKAQASTLCEGLSPRVRGNHWHHVFGDANFRSIPACAGEPRRWSKKCGRVTVYPRVCGGTKQRDVTGRRRRGLSPRVRGNPSRGRSIPA